MIIAPSSPRVATRGLHARKGLSLLEVLVALAIFLMSLVALSQLVSLGTDRARDVQWLSQGSMIAQSRMAEVLAGSLSLTGVSESACDEDQDWNWSMSVEADSTPGLYQVTVTVSRAYADGTKFTTSLNQFVLDPTLRGNTDGSTTGTDDPAATGTTGSTTTGGSSTTGGTSGSGS